MSASAFTHLFIFFLILTFVVRCWLSTRQIRHIRAHQEKVPEQFAGSISLASHQKAAAYTVAKTRFALVSLIVETVVLLSFTLLGGLEKLSDWIHGWTGNNMIYQIALIALTSIIVGAIDVPFDYWQQFVLEEKFGFNKMTPALFVGDIVKSAILGVIIGLPVIWVLLTVMGKAGTWWWLYAWILWTIFQYLMLFLYPTFIAPLFNKFTPLPDEQLRMKIENLMKRVGFQSKGLFVMDGSKRSAHGNAYFTGFGAAKRVVFFDTLIEKLSPEEIEAVLAHELGHFRLKHVMKRMIATSILSLVFLAILGYLKSQSWCYAGLGVDSIPAGGSDAGALILFALTLPIFTFFLSPLMAISSRKHEFEADAFSAQYTQADDLVHALVKMYQDNAATLTPDPLHSAFYDSHPPASQRINHLLGHS